MPNNTLGLPNRSRERSRERHADPLGLSVLYQPKTTTPSLDIIFIHGLGGTSRQTWCKNRDRDLFWPERWLPFEPDISTARILTFGYNAHFMSSAGASPILNISDFAKDLLYDMRFGKDGNMENLEIGQVAFSLFEHA